ncbi:MAG: hypothetical protein ABI637_03525 [Gemmatimonadota bacterium]
MIASAVTFSGAALACGGGASKAGAPPPPAPVRTLPLAGVFLMGAKDTVPADTVAVLTAGQARHIVMRIGAPDLTTFADIFFDTLAFQAAPGAPVRITLQPADSAFGLVVASDTPFQNGGEITFKYAVHFPAPTDALAKYGTVQLLERALAIGRIDGAGNITLLASTRPAADNLQAPMAQPGTYLVAAVR